MADVNLIVFTFELSTIINKLPVSKRLYRVNIIFDTIEISHHSPLSKFFDIILVSIDATTTSG